MSFTFVVNHSPRNINQTKLVVEGTLYSGEIPSKWQGKIAIYYPGIPIHFAKCVDRETFCCYIGKDLKAPMDDVGLILEREQALLMIGEGSVIWPVE